MKWNKKKHQFGLRGIQLQNLINMILLQIKTITLYETVGLASAMINNLAIYSQLAVFLWWRISHSSHDVTHENHQQSSPHEIPYTERNAWDSVKSFKTYHIQSDDFLSFNLISSVQPASFRKKSWIMGIKSIFFYFINYKCIIYQP